MNPIIIIMLLILLALVTGPFTVLIIAGVASLFFFPAFGIFMGGLFIISQIMA